MTDEIQDPGAMARALRWGKGQFSLDAPKDQPFFSAETAGDTALGFVPGATIPMAMRDFERARREDDKLGMGLSVVSALPLGNLVKGLRGPINKIIAGSAAKEAPYDAMLAARNALKKGADPEAVWQEHGVFKGYDKGPVGGQLKWEIPDTNAKFKEGAFGTGSKYQGRLGDLLDHPELFQNYPQLADLNIKSQYGKGLKSTGGQLGQDIKAGASDPQELLRVLLHEIQHGVQDIEKFGKGGNPSKFTSQAVRSMLSVDPSLADTILDPKSSAWKKIAKESMGKYQALPGEVESRSVERRYNMLPEELRKYSPLHTAKKMGYGPEKVKPAPAYFDDVTDPSNPFP